MIYLDKFEKWAPQLDACAQKFLSKDELEYYFMIPEEDRQAQLKALLEQPISHFSIINEVLFRARWAEVVHTLRPAGELALLEVASGDADMIPQAMARIHPGSRYVTANMNKALTKSLMDKTAGLDVGMEVVEDDASRIESHFGRDCFDIIAFQHAVNDVVQAILCDREGVDTIWADWMETLPLMIKMLQKEVANGTLEQSVKAPLLGLMRSLLTVLKPGGYFAINHYMFQLDLDWGYPPRLFSGFMPMVREWFKELEGTEEVFFEGYEPNWWIFLRKK